MEDNKPRQPEAPETAHSVEPSYEQVRPVNIGPESDVNESDKNQFRRAWEKLFGDIANTVEVKPQTVEEPSRVEVESTLQRTIEAADNGEPIEKLNELRQEVKDTPSTVQGAASVGRVMAEALTKRQENISPSLSATEGLHRTMAKQASTSNSNHSIYKKAIIIGFCVAMVLVIIAIISVIINSK